MIEEQIKIIKNKIKESNKISNEIEEFNRRVQTRKEEINSCFRTFLYDVFGSEHGEFENLKSTDFDFDIKDYNSFRIVVNFKYIGVVELWMLNAIHKELNKVGLNLIYIDNEDNKLRLEIAEYEV